MSNPNAPLTRRGSVVQGAKSLVSSLSARVKSLVSDGEADRKVTGRPPNAARLDPSLRAKWDRYEQSREEITELYSRSEALLRVKEQHKDCEARLLAMLIEKPPEGGSVTSFKDQVAVHVQEAMKEVNRAKDVVEDLEIRRQAHDKAVKESEETKDEPDDDPVRANALRELAKQKQMFDETQARLGQLFDVVEEKKKLAFAALYKGYVASQRDFLSSLSPDAAPLSSSSAVSSLSLSAPRSSTSSASSAPSSSASIPQKAAASLPAGL